MKNRVLHSGKVWFFVVVAIGVLLFGKQAEAAETTTLRVISTTDIHNQINSENYDLAGKSTNKSLARLNTMIKGARAEMTEGGSITVDVGDSVYGYGAEMIMGGDMFQPNNDLQPIFIAMGKVGYDAMVLGNHDFDYGYTFIKNQIELAGLYDAYVVANIKDLGTGKYPWNRTKMITKELKTSKGDTVSIKIGIVGVARQNISTYYDYNGILQGESALKTVRTQAAALKKQGADIVIAMAHCGIGEENSGDDDADVGYALSKISDVDCVILGHQHRNYPSNDDNTSMFYKLPNIDKVNGLTNGKPVVMVADHAAGIGIADMTLKIDGDAVAVVSARAEVRKSSVLVLEDPEIKNITEEYDSIIKETYGEILAGVKPGSAITGYFATLEDNYAIQLNNEAKIRFGMDYIHSSAGAKYSSYHVIAATKFYMDGSEGKDDYIEIGDNFTMKDVLNTQEYQHNNNYVYWITGAQLKEWLEWSASIYAQNGETITSDKELASLLSANAATSVISNNWLNNWRSYTIFDGLEYRIDASRPARYNHGGTIINEDSRRVVSLTCDGKEVTDDMKFILVENNFSQTHAVYGVVNDQRITSKAERTSTYLKRYVEELGSFGELGNDVDNNWSVSFGNTAYIIRSSSLSELYAALKPWYRGTLKVTEDYAYYEADLSGGTEASEDVSGPLLVLCPSTTEETQQDIIIYIQASDSSGVAAVYFMRGQHDSDEDGWSKAQKLSGRQIAISENGIYSICAVDNNGNRTVKNINISNINTAVLQVPTVDKFTNKKTEVTGETQAGLSVHITIGDQTYNTTANSSGTYSCTVGKQMAGDTVSVYVSDSEGRVSKEASTKVLRRGPNTPSLNAVTNKTITLTGKINDTNSTVLAYIGKKVYVPKEDGTEIYKGCAKYNKEKKITNALNYSVSDGIFYIQVPVPVAEKKITIFAVDTEGKCSLTEAQIAVEEAPNQPKVNSVCEVERYVSGEIPETTKVCKVTVKAGSQSFSANSDKTGHFSIKTKGFAAGTVLQVSASDSQDGKTRTSAIAECTVSSKGDYILSSSKSKITVKAIDSYSTVLEGKVKEDGVVYVNYGETSAQVALNSDGSFSYTFPSPLAGGTSFYIERHNKSSGEIEELKEVTVKSRNPEAPTISTKKISKSAQSITILAKEKATIIVKTGGKKIKVTECKYNTKKQVFVYTVDIPKGKGKLTCTLKNSIGTSKATTVTRQ